MSSTNVMCKDLLLIVKSFSSKRKLLLCRSCGCWDQYNEDYYAKKCSLEQHDFQMMTFLTRKRIRKSLEVEASLS